MSKNHRLKQIENFLLLYGSVDISVLSQKLGVSEMTVRRDLSALSSQGKAIRTHGGAVLPRERFASEINLDNRSLLHIREKKAIAREAIQYLRSGESVFIDDSSTSLSMAEFIPHNRQFHITTNSLFSALELNKLPNVEVICLGGPVSKTHKAVTGFWSASLLKNMYFKTAFVSAPFISSNGVLTLNNFDECLFKKSILDQTENPILLIDSSKILDNLSYFHLGAVKDFHLVITDENAPEKFLLFCREQLVPLAVVKVNSDMFE